jgi:hypothetical protein
MKEHEYSQVLRNNLRGKLGVVKDTNEMNRHSTEPTSAPDI